jgi:hypothetical protein
LVEVRAQPFEPVLPARAALADPLLGETQGHRLDLACAHAADLLGPDEPARLQHLQVLEHSGQRHGERLRELRHRGRSAREPLDHLAPARVGERTEHAIEGGALVRHVLKYCRRSGCVKLWRSVPSVLVE